MTSGIKAIVFRTPELTATREFFEQALNFTIKESSPRHFVVHSKGLRIVFLESAGDFGVEMYVTTPAALKTCKDPNGITVIIADKT